MSFSIKFLDEPRFYEEDESVPFRRGRIVIGHFEEEFVAPLHFWSERDYERQWCAGVAHILAGATSSCLETSVGDPTNREGVRWWAFYRVGDEVAFHEEIPLPRLLGDAFDPAEPYSRVGTYEKDPEVSEWRVEHLALKAFLEQQT